MLTTVNVTSITIESDSGWYRAYLCEGEEGVSIYFWRRAAGNGATVFKPLYETVLEVPFHVALYRVSDIVNELTSDVTSWAPRLREVERK